jgi:hypothetical protein
MIEQKMPWHLWIVGIVSLLWNAMGGVDYTMTHLRSEAWLAQMTPAQIDWVNHFPIWATSCWALGVWGAIGGSLLLLLRSRWAVTAFGVSLFGLIGTRVYQYTGDAPGGLNTASDLGFSAILAAVAVALLYYARRMRGKEVLR